MMNDLVSYALPHSSQIMEWESEQEQGWEQGQGWEQEQEYVEPNEANGVRQKPKSQGDKSINITQRTNGFVINDEQRDSLISKFNGIKLPKGEETVFKRFNMFKSQLQRHPQLKYCVFKQELVNISLILTKYYLINQEFDQQQFLNQKVQVIHFLTDIYLIISENQLPHLYQDQFEIVFGYLRGHLNQEESQKQDCKKWEKLLKLFSKQLFINKNFYKSHLMDYRIFIKRENYREEKKDDIWYDLREDQFEEKKKGGQPKVDQSKVGKRDFDLLMERQQKNYKQGIQSNIGEFTLCYHFEEVRNNVKVKNSLIYADDIFNVVIKYEVIM